MALDSAAAVVLIACSSVVRSGKDIIYIDKIENNTTAFRMASQVGMSLPMIYTASGKAIMSYLSKEELNKIWNESEVISKTPKTITDFNLFMEEIKGVRENGYAVDNEENELGVCCIATAVADIEGNFKYAVSVSVPKVRLSLEKEEFIKNMLKNLISDNNF